MLQIGPCDYLDELRPLSPAASLTADSAPAHLHQEKQAQAGLLAEGMQPAGPVEQIWEATDEADDPAPRTEIT
jgi:hypothetical protein